MMATTTPRAKLAPIDSLRPHERNRRAMAEDRFVDLRKSIRDDPTFLWHRPVSALPDGRIVGGRWRWEAAKAEGWTEIPAVLEDVDEATALSRMLRDNVEYGIDDEQMQAEILFRLRELEVDVDLTGLPSGDVAEILARYGPGETDDEPPDEFPDADPAVDYRCPSCGYGWSGVPT